MGGNPGNLFLFFFSPSGSFSLSTGGRGLEGRASNRAQGGRARPLYRLTLARPPFPLPFPCPLSLSLSRPHLSSLPLAHLFHLSAPPQARRRRPEARAQISARRAPPALPLRPLRPWERLPPRRRGASHRLFSFCSAAPSPTGAGRPAAAPPTPRLRVRPQGLGAPALPDPGPRLRLVTVFYGLGGGGGQRRPRVGFAARM